MFLSITFPASQERAVWQQSGTLMATLAKALSLRLKKFFAAYCKQYLSMAAVIRHRLYRPHRQHLPVEVLRRHFQRPRRNIEFNFTREDIPMARFQLDLSDTHEVLLEKLRVLCDLKTKKDVVENALMLMGWAATEASNGLKIAAVDDARKVYKEVHTSALEGARHSHERLSRVSEKGRDDRQPVAIGMR